MFSKACLGLYEDVGFKLVSVLSLTHGAGVLEASSRRLELQRGNSVGQTEPWYEGPACHDICLNADDQDLKCQ